MIGRPRTVSDAEILDAAARAIAQRGPGRLTLAHVAAEVGLVPATLLQRFGSKRGLLLAVAGRGAEAVGAIFAAARAAHPAPLAALHAALTDLVAGIDSPAILANHLAFLQLDLTDPDLRTNAVRHSREMRHEIRHLLEAAIAAGDLVAADGERLAQAVQTTYNGALLTWAIDGRGDLADWLRLEIDFLLAPYRRGGAT
jgi:AcrR family transcriptional regulator